jgi:hypothetical protein
MRSSTKRAYLRGGFAVQREPAPPDPMLSLNRVRRLQRVRYGCLLIVRAERGTGTAVISGPL